MVVVLWNDDMDANSFSVPGLTMFTFICFLLFISQLTHKTPERSGCSNLLPHSLCHNISLAFRRRQLNVRYLQMYIPRAPVKIIRVNPRSVQVTVTSQILSQRQIFATWSKSILFSLTLLQCDCKLPRSDLGYKLVCQGFEILISPKF